MGAGEKQEFVDSRAYFSVFEGDRARGLHEILTKNAPRGVGL